MIGARFNDDCKKVLYRVSQKRSVEIKMSNGGLKKNSNRNCGVKTLPYLLTAALIWSYLKGWKGPPPLSLKLFYDTLYSLRGRTFCRCRIHWRRCKTVFCAEQTGRTGRGQNPVHRNFYEMFFLLEFFFGTHSLCGKPFRKEEYRGDKCEEKAQWEHPVKFGLHHSFQLSIPNILILQIKEHLCPHTSFNTFKKKVFKADYGFTISFRFYIYFQIWHQSFENCFTCLYTYIQ